MQNTNNQVAFFGGGCFWYTEAVFSALKGVVSVIPGYSGGTVANPTYEQVSSGKTSHAEVAKIEFDPATIGFTDLLTVFFNTHDPTTLNRQGNDAGTQYRSVIFYSNEEQKVAASEFVSELNSAKAYSDPIVTEVLPLGEFYEAEDYHQKYYETHKDAPYCEIIIAPKLEKLQKKYKELLKD